MTFLRLRRAFARAILSLVLLSLAPSGLMSPAAAQTKVRVGYIPVLGSAQLFVIEGAGWAKEEGLDLELIRFQSGPQAIQALAAGQLEAYLAGVLPLLVARSKGVDVKVIAAGAIEELQLLARGPLADADGANFKEAVAAFTATQGRRPKIAAQPQGSVPDTLLRYWLAERGVDPQSVEIAGIDIDAAQQAFLTGSVDAAVLREPAVTVVLGRVKNSKVLVSGHQMMPDQPGSALALYKPGTPEAAAIGPKLLRLHLRATELLRDRPAQAAPYVLSVLGSGILTLDQIKSALTGGRGAFVADPALIIEPVAKLQDFQIKLGVIRSATPVADLFDLTLYQRAAK